MTREMVLEDTGLENAADSPTGVIAPATADELDSRLDALQSVNAKLLFLRDIKTVYEEMARSARQVLGCDFCALYTYERPDNLLLLQARAGDHDPERRPEIHLDDPGSIQAQAFQEEYLVYIPDLRENRAERRENPEIRSQLCIPISSNQGPVGLFDFGSRRVDAFAHQDVRIASILVDQAAFSLENIRLLGDLTASRDAVIRGMALLAESRDGQIGGHIDRICAFSHLFATRLRQDSPYEHLVDDDFLETINRAAALHDIGKVGIPDRILLKPGKLTEKEYEIVKTHTTIGGSLLVGLIRDHGSFPTLRMGAEVAYGHHEWWDGSGYPHGQRGQAIPLSARIVTVADVFDALTSRRVYKEAWEAGEAFLALKERAGTQFDPHLLDLFTELAPQLLEIRNELSDYIMAWDLGPTPRHPGNAPGLIRPGALPERRWAGHLPRATINRFTPDKGIVWFFCRDPFTG